MSIIGPPCEISGIMTCFTRGRSAASKHRTQETSKRLYCFQLVIYEIWWTGLGWMWQKETTSLCNLPDASSFLPILPVSEHHHKHLVCPSETKMYSPDRAGAGEVLPQDCFQWFVTNTGTQMDRPVLIYIFRALAGQSSEPNTKGSGCDWDATPTVAPAAIAIAVSDCYAVSYGRSRRASKRTDMLKVIEGL
jgi:hypothetical protein